MMHAPSDSEILLAEQRFSESRRQVKHSASRARVAFRDTLAKPGTLLGVAGAAGILGYLVFKRPAPEPRNVSHAPSTSTAPAAASTSLLGILIAFAMRYAAKELPGIGVGLLQKAMRHDAGAGAYPATVRSGRATLH
jgi:hypothetical protein